MSRRNIWFAALAMVGVICGCAGHSATSKRATFTNWGTVDIVNGVPFTRTLADGRTCTVTPTILNHTSVQVVASAASGKGDGGMITLATTLPTEEAVLFSLDAKTTVSVTLHEADQPGQ